MTRNDYLSELLKYYEITKELSRKENSLLLRLRHKDLGRDMVVRSTAREMPVADFLKSIVHPNLPEVYDAVHLRDGTVVLEEALDGITLEEALKDRTLSYRESRAILCSVSDALTVIHNAGFVHRDIKPRNIILLHNGGVKLIDFDAAREASENDDTVRLGTAGFAAPEQYIGASDHRADIFALGVLLNIMLTGRHPSEVLPKNTRVRYVIEKATSMNPEKRFSTAEEFMEAL